MIIVIIEFVLILVTAFLIRNAKTLKSIESYLYILVMGIILFLFEAVIAVLTGEEVSGGVIQLSAEIIGVYCIIWSIIKIIKGKKKDNSAIISTTK